jgi:hypothetical protein
MQGSWRFCVSGDRSLRARWLEWKRWLKRPRRLARRGRAPGAGAGGPQRGPDPPLQVSASAGGHRGLSLVDPKADPQAKPLLSAICVSNQNGPAPVFEEQAVPPLW